MSGFDVEGEQKERVWETTRFHILCGLGDQRQPCTGKEISLCPLTYSISTLGRWPCLLSIAIFGAVCCGH